MAVKGSYGAGGGGRRVEASKGGREEGVEILRYRIVCCGAREAEEVCRGASMSLLQQYMEIRQDEMRDGEKRKHVPRSAV